MPAGTEEAGYDQVRAYYDRKSRKYGYEIVIPEGVLNRMEYRLLNACDTDEAIRIFEENVAAHPNSANVYDSLGEAFLAIGDPVNAGINYTRSLELDPDNSNARNMLLKLQQ